MSDLGSEMQDYIRLREVADAESLAAWVHMMRLYFVSLTPDKREAFLTDLLATPQDPTP